jgi:organic radical activating enzyme
MNTFTPDLVVEVTGACNRACVGCYAPNVVSNEGATELFEKRPELFLSIVGFNRALNELSVFPKITAIRGGEPSLHPKLAILLKMASVHSAMVMLETHGRWLLPENIKAYGNLVKSIRENRIVVKISFDKMHGLKKDDLQKITDFLGWNEIDYRIAITESTSADFIQTRSQCYWIEDEKIIYQPKATHESELIKPILGTINKRGELNSTLTNRFNEDSSLGVAFA